MSERWEEPVRTEQDARLEEEERGDLCTYISVQDDWLDD